jgi:hypothetical protein
MLKIDSMFLILCFVKVNQIDKRIYIHTVQAYVYFCIFMTAYLEGKSHYRKAQMQKKIHSIVIFIVAPSLSSYSEVFCS